MSRAAPTLDAELLEFRRNGSFRCHDVNRGLLQELSYDGSKGLVPGGIQSRHGGRRRADDDDGQTCLGEREDLLRYRYRHRRS